MTNIDFEPPRNASERSRISSAENVGGGRSSGVVGVIMRRCSGPWSLRMFGFLSALESFIVPVPLDAVMLPIGMAQPNRIFLLTLYGVVGSIIGACLGYAIGLYAYDAIGAPIVALYGFESQFERFRDLYIESDWLAVMVGAITPIPFKVVAIVSGVFQMDLATFVLAALVGRSARFALSGVIIALFGERLRLLMERHSGKFMIAMFAIMISGFLAMGALAL